MGLPSGTNKCIGTYANESTGKFYSFIYNSLGNHTINELDTKLNTIVIILQGSFLNFQEFEFVNGVGIIDNKFLYWTDGYNPPRGIEIEKAKGEDYYTDSDSICLAKAPPLNLITSGYANDPSGSTTASNRLKNQLFQFRYLYVYDDGSRSAWSSCSEVPFPELDVNADVSAEAYRNNNIILSFNAGTKFVKTIEIAAQVKGVSTTVNTTDWFQILSIDRADVLTLPVYSYNATTNTASYRFFNDGLYQSVDIFETDLAYDYVPLKSKTLEVANGNVLLLGNNTEGYDNINIDVNYSVSYLENTGISRLASVYLPYPPVIGTPSATIKFTGIPFTGDAINGTISFVDTDNPGIPFTFSQSYTVPTLANGSLIAFAYDYANYIGTTLTTGVIYGEVDTTAIDGSVSIVFYTTPPNAGDFISFNSPVTLASGVTATLSKPNYKTNSKYQFGLVYYDDFNRSSYVQTNNSSIISTQSFGAVEGKYVKIDWNIRHSAPLWATRYQWVRTEQLTHLTFQFSTADAVAIDGTDYYNLTTPPLTYDFSAGDRCTIHRKGTTTWVSGYDVQVISYTPVGTTSGTLKIQKKDTLTPSVLFELYTPKTRANSSTENFFYEFGEVYTCSAGTHSVTSGSFVKGDIFTRQRNTVKIEDPNFSDLYKSNYSSNGRANIFAPQAKQLNLPTDIRYSDTYVPNTNINGLSRFYGAAFDTYDRVNGSIQKLAIRDNYLICFQELKTGYIPIMQSIIEDQGTGNNANVAISTKLLNKIRYYVGDFGIGLNPESFARFAGTMYFADPNRGFILKLSGGLEPISSKGMDSYFTKKLTVARSVTNVKLIGGYDPRNDEYLFTTNYVTGTGTSETIAYNENNNIWTSFYTFIPEMSGYIFNRYFTFKDGGMWEHNVSPDYNSFYGTVYPSIVQLTFNGSPKQIKSFLGVLQQGDSVWTAPDITTSISTVSAQQHSSLIVDDFYKKEGVWFSSLLRDDTSPGGLLEGEDLKGNWIKLRLSNSSIYKINLLSVDIRAIPSYQGVK